MRAPSANKASMSTGTKCHRCGRDDRACRPVDLGYWCQADGLVETLPYIETEPPADSVAVHSDPTVVELAAAISEAQAVADAAHAAWVASIRDLSTHQLEPRGVVVTSRLNRNGPRAKGTEEKLRAASDEAKELREDAYSRLTRLRERHARAVAAAHTRFVSSTRPKENS